MPPATDEMFVLWHETDLSCNLTMSAPEGRTDILIILVEVRV